MKRHTKGGKPMNTISYTRCGDYLLPDIVLRIPPREQTEPSTKYGAMRRSFLQEHRPITYNRLLLSERLFQHLCEVQQTAHEWLDRLRLDILKTNPPPDKSVDSLAWAAHMTAIRHTAEKIVLDEIVYI